MINGENQAKESECGLERERERARGDSSRGKIHMIMGWYIW